MRACHRGHPAHDSGGRRRASDCRACRSGIQRAHTHERARARERASKSVRAMRHAYLRCISCSIYHGYILDISCIYHVYVMYVSAYIYHVYISVRAMHESCLCQSIRSMGVAALVNASLVVPVWRESARERQRAHTHTLGRCCRVQKKKMY